MEAPLPGTIVYDRMVAQSRLRQAPMWHFFLHNAPNNLAETLTAGRERIYINRFFDELAYDTGAFTDADLDRYATAFEAPGAMRAGFELYRAFDQDGDANRAALERFGKLRMPVLGLDGSASFFAPVADEMLREVADDVTTAAISRSGHWIAEENPYALLEALGRFLDKPA